MRLVDHSLMFNSRSLRICSLLMLAIQDICTLDLLDQEIFIRLSMNNKNLESPFKYYSTWHQEYFA